METQMDGRPQPRAAHPGRGRCTGQEGPCPGAWPERPPRDTGTGSLGEVTGQRAACQSLVGAERRSRGLRVVWAAPESGLRGSQRPGLARIPTPVLQSRSPGMWGKVLNPSSPSFRICKTGGGGKNSPLSPGLLWT